MKKTSIVKALLGLPLYVTLGIVLSNILLYMLHGDSPVTRSDTPLTDLLAYLACIAVCFIIQLLVNKRFPHGFRAN